MRVIRVKPVKVNITTHRVGNKIAVKTTVNGRSRTKYF